MKNWLQIAFNTNYLSFNNYVSKITIKVIMAHTFRKALLAGAFALGALVSPAVAEESSNWYGTAGLGYSMLNDADWEIDSIDNEGDVELDAGLGFSFGVGYDWGNTRAEFTYGSNNGGMDQITNDDGDAASVDGDLTLNSFMVSVYRDFPNDSSKWTPYVGVGIGTTSVEIDDLTEDGTNYGDEDGSGFSYQLKAGVSVNVSEKADIYGEVQYLNVSTVEMADDELELDTSSWGIFSGIRYQF